jgi:hypothetical protein
MSQHDLDAIARAIVDSNLFMTIATADATGRPWASPVYYASATYAELGLVPRRSTRATSPPGPR